MVGTSLKAQLKVLCCKGRHCTLSWAIWHYLHPPPLLPWVWNNLSVASPTVHLYAGPLGSSSLVSVSFLVLCSVWTQQMNTKQCRILNHLVVEFCFSAQEVKKSLLWMMAVLWIRQQSCVKNCSELVKCCIWCFRKNWCLGLQRKISLIILAWQLSSCFLSTLSFQGILPQAQDFFAFGLLEEK